MKTSIHFVLLLSALLFGACGGSGSDGASGGGGSSGGEHCEHHGEECDHHGEHGHGEHGEHEHGDHHGEEHHHGMSAEVQAFHDVLAPIYHMEPGAERNAAACENVDSFRTHTATVAAATPEGADAEGWASASAQLSASLETFATECSSGGANVEAQFEAFHTAFHGVMEAGH